MLATLLAALLSACGFQLQTEQTYPAGLSPMVFATQVPAGELYDELVEAFAEQSLRLSQRPADVLLTVHALDYQQARIGQFDAVQVTVQWSLINAWGDAVIYKQLLIERAEVQRDDALPNQYDELNKQVNNQLAMSILAELRLVETSALQNYEAGP